MCADISRFDQNVSKRVILMALEPLLHEVGNMGLPPHINQIIQKIPYFLSHTLVSTKNVTGLNGYTQYKGGLLSG